MATAMLFGQVGGVEFVCRFCCGFRFIWPCFVGLCYDLSVRFVFELLVGFNTLPMQLPCSIGGGKSFFDFQLCGIHSFELDCS